VCAQRGHHLPSSALPTVRPFAVYGLLYAALTGIGLALLLMFVALFLHAVGVGRGFTSTGAISFSFALQVGIASPFIETIALQAIPLLLVRQLSSRESVHFVVLTAAFIFTHWGDNLNVSITVGIIGGSFISYFYLAIEKRCNLCAIFITWCVHGVCNLSLLGFSHLLTIFNGRVFQ
jgi:hypothetical protein